MAGFVYLVGAGPGDPGLLTVRARRLIARADVIVADRLVGAGILDEVPPSAEVIMRGARADAAAQIEINALLVERARRGQFVVRLKGGDPFVFGRGGEEAEALVDAGVPFAVVPGVTAAIAAPAYAGIPLTHRGLAGAVAFATGHETDDKADGAVAWSELAHAAGTLILYMSVKRLDEVMRRLIDAGRSADEPVAVIERGTTPEQRVVTGTIGDIAARALAAEIKPPALTVVGKVVSLRERIAWFEKRRRILVIGNRPTGNGNSGNDSVGNSNVGTSSSAAIGSVDNSGAGDSNDADGNSSGSDGSDGGGERFDVDVTFAPPMQIVARWADVKAALARLGDARTIAFVSARAVDAFFAALHGSDLDARALFGKKVAAVGRATAAQLAIRGIRADVVGDGGGAELARELIAAAAPPAMLLGAAGGRHELADALTAAGWSVDSVAAYDSVLDEKALARALKIHRLRPFDAIGFTSPRAADAFCDLAGAALGTPRICALGATTRAALEARGITVAAVPAEPSVAALVSSLAAFPELE